MLPAQQHMVHGSGGGVTAGTSSIIQGTFGQPIAGALHHFEMPSLHNAGFWLVRDTAVAPPPDTTAIATIIVDSASPSIGEVFALPIRLLDGKGLDQANADTVDITLRFEGTCLEVRETGQLTYDADTAEVVITAVRSEMEGDVLSTLDLRARLGSVTGTVLRIASVAWRGAPFVNTTTRDGLVEIEGVCMAGGRARLVRDVQAGFIRSVAPNPAQSSIRVVVHGPAGLTNDVRLVDMMGRMIATSNVTISSDGTAEAVLECTDAANGLYAVQLLSGSTIFSTPVMVQR